MNTVIRVLIVDDHPIYREGLITTLRSQQGNVDIVGQADDGAAAVEMVGELQPDVVLMDIKMPGMNGIEATKQVKLRFPDVKILAISAYDIDDYILEMVRAGASGYVLKDADQSLIVSAINAVYEGNVHIHPRLAAKVFAAYAALSNGHSRTARDLHDGLTERELEVLQLVAGGWTSRQVSKQLWISERTVESHIQNIYQKLNIGDRTQAALYAIRKGLIHVQEYHGQAS